MRAHGELFYCPRCGKEIYPASEPCANCHFGEDPELNDYQIEELKVLVNKLLIIAKLFVDNGNLNGPLEIHQGTIKLLDLENNEKYGGLIGVFGKGPQVPLIPSEEEMYELLSP